MRKLFRPRPGLLVLQLEGNRVALFDLAQPGDGSSPRVTTGAFTYVTSGGGDVFVGASIDDPNVQRLSGLRLDNIEPSWATLPDSGSDHKGPDALATDCISTYAAREDQSIWRVPNDGGGTFTRWLDAGARQAVASAADGRYVYFAAYNAGGVFAFDKTSSDWRHIYNGNVWGVHADLQGVYWGEHEPGPDAGKIYVVRR
ncbi:MAG: hypothetical protein KIT84_14135 [Labilithrix sp.]|nr:hypothetical protein [Labilithrix sp.]MCW5812160.1 hypothetical protein [Labilithrix sp.]